MKGVNASGVDFIEGKQFHKVLQIKGVAYMIREVSSLEEAREVCPEELKPVMQEFQGVFRSSQSLPPHRACNYMISLIDPNITVNARPHRYPFHQKNETEKQINEMLKAGIIHPSSSPFASSVVLVHKADGSWQLRVDYRALNRNTIKDKFPISLIDDLLDELHGAKYFSKLDL